LLQEEFTLVQVDRRGRGLSRSEADQYSIEREAEDLIAVLAGCEQPAMVFAHSYGATVTMAALDGLPAAAVLMYEPPFDTPGHEVVPAALLRRWAGLLAAGRREHALESFYRDVLRFDEAAIDALRPLPIWQARIATVHTMVREGEAVARFQPPPLQPAMPVRILLGEATTAQLAASTRVAAERIAGSELRILPGQGHVAIDTAPELIAQHVRATWQRAGI
jgi:pimeloyl-ACP methyl ester carboxylesterase